MNYKFLFYLVIFFLINGLIFDLEILLFFLSFFFLHINWGMYSIFLDYIHKKKLVFFFNSLLKILIIENLLQISFFFF